MHRTYAHLCSPSFAQAANDLKDTLVAKGFEQEKAETVIQRQNDWLGGTTPSLPLAPPPLRLLSAEKPDLSDLSQAEQAQVEIREAAPGKIEINIKGDVTEDLATKLVSALPKTERAEAQKTLATHRQVLARTLSPAEQKLPFKVPRLCLWVQGDLEIAERELFLDVNGWNLSGQPRASFWLPTSTDRFYPDFVALLEDGRLLVVEYKGAAYAANDDSKEKRLLGELWEAKSNGKGLFLMAEKIDRLGRGVFDQIAVKISS